MDQLWSESNSGTLVPINDAGLSAQGASISFKGPKLKVLQAQAAPHTVAWGYRRPKKP